MNGIDFVVDTNTIIYLFSGKACATPYTDSNLIVSVITEMELLSFPRITNDEAAALKSFISDCIVIPLEERIKERAILLRRKYGTKLPDAIVAATAIEYGFPLVTADKGFKKIEELDLRLLEL